MKFPYYCEHSGRYRIVAELRSRAGASIGWRAADLVFGDDVVVYPLPPEFRADAGRTAAFETSFARASEAAHSGTVRWHSLDLASGFAVREWVNGFTLLDLLRRQRKLTVSDAITLLNGLPNLLDWLSANGVTPPGDLLEESWVTFQPAFETAELLETPMSEWPPYQIKLPLLHPRDFWNQYAENSPEITQRPDAPPSEISVRLAFLLRELLGDRIRSNPWRPLPTLNEKANELLADTLNGAASRSAHDFWAAIVAAAADSRFHRGGGKARVASLAFHIPPACAPERRRVAILDPQDHAHPPIQLCAGTNFLFGRDESLVDFRTIVLPETSENNKLSVEISRVHARIEARDGTLWLRDGDGQSASRNGAHWNDVALPSSRPIRMHGRGVLNLAKKYSLALTPVPGEFARSLMLGDKPVSPLASMLPSAIIPSPLGGQRPFHRAVWVLTALGFHLDASGNIEWHHGGAIPPAAIFIRDHAGFWLANAGLPAQSIRVGEAEPKPGEAAPLLAGQSLRIGNRIYSILLRD